MTGEELRRELTGAAAERPLAGGETPDQVEAAVERIGDLLLTLEEPDRSELFEEALAKIPSERSSLRKLEKKIRQTAIAVSAQGRYDEVAELAPDIVIDDLRGTIRFRRHDEAEVRIENTRLIVAVVARIVGGPLERALLTRSAAEFVAEARPALQAELDSARRATEQAAARINVILDERAHRPLYNAKSLRRIVQRAVREAEDLDEAVERIMFEVAPLDREAAERERVRSLVEERGLIAYREYFPRARSLKRELVLYAGPTNSGKTWRALNELAAARSGAYLAPLRLLALEGQEEIERRGRSASYITGEERDIREGANFVASTIEMMDTHREVDVVVIDEVQLLTDEDRGWAWCQALVGAPAKRVLMTGSPDCIPLVRAMAEYLDEPLEVHMLERHTPIVPEPQALALSKIEAGTAVIAFSRRDVLAIKAELEGRFRVAVIYGNLTPEVRREEARRFRSGEAQVVVSTDAIAMGLNLPIRTVCFSTLRKWNGREEVQLEPWQILQIGGRAGRFGHFERGHVGALEPRDARRIAQVFAHGYSPPERATATTVRPGAEHIEVIAEGMHTHRLARALAAFQRGMTFDSPLLSPGVQEDMIMLAELADRYRDIPLAERLAFSCAPVDAKLEWLVEEFDLWMRAYANGEQVTLEPLRPGYTKERAAHDQELMAAEQEAKRLTLYAWLAYRFPDTFPELDECTAQRVALDRFIERSLAQKPGRRSPGRQAAGARGGRGNGRPGDDRPRPRSGRRRR